MHPVKILVADDHPVIRKMVTFALQTDERFSIVGQAENGLQAAVQQAKILKPHVVILNITMPVMDGFEAARRIRQHLPEVAIVILRTIPISVSSRKPGKSAPKASLPRPKPVWR